jgi:hypothetical protein
MVHEHGLVANNVGGWWTQMGKRGNDIICSLRHVGMVIQLWKWLVASQKGSKVPLVLVHEMSFHKDPTSFVKEDVQLEELNLSTTS